MDSSVRDGQIVAKIASGMSRRAVAAEHGVSVSLVGLIVRRDVGKQQRPEPLSPYAKARIKVLAENGKTLHQICLEIGASEWRVRMVLQTNKIRLRRAQKATNAQRKAATILVGKGWTYSRAAKELGLSRSAVAGAVYRASR